MTQTILRLTGWYGWELRQRGSLTATGFSPHQRTAVRDAVAVTVAQGVEIIEGTLVIFGPGGGRWNVARDPDTVSGWVCLDVETGYIVSRVK